MDANGSYLLRLHAHNAALWADELDLAVRARPLDRREVSECLTQLEGRIRMLRRLLDAASPIDARGPVRLVSFVSEERDESLRSDTAKPLEASRRGVRGRTPLRP